MNHASLCPGQGVGPGLACGLDNMVEGLLRTSEARSRETWKCRLGGLELVPGREDAQASLGTAPLLLQVREGLSEVLEKLTPGHSPVSLIQQGRGPVEENRTPVSSPRAQRPLGTKGTNQVTLRVRYRGAPEPLPTHPALMVEIWGVPQSACEPTLESSEVKELG